MPRSFHLPDLGEGIHEAEILEIAVTTGQPIQEGEPLVELETDKAVVEIPSPFTGTVQEIHIAPGDTIQVGGLMFTFADAKQPTSTGSQPPATPEAATGLQQSGTEPDRSRPMPAAPSTRRLARELDVDLYLVTPTGANGVVTSEDVRHFAERQAEPVTARTPPEPTADAQLSEQPRTQIIPVQPESLPDFSRFGEVSRVPFRSIRRATANRMSTSWSQIPHVNCQDMVDITALEDFRQRHKNAVAKEGGRLTMTVFAMKAVATALKNFPQFNASLDLERQEIIIKQYFHLGIAVDTDHGLVVPVIRDVDRKSIKELAIEVHEAIDRARERSLTREELVGGTFTITNAGAIGGAHFSAIINYPEVAILGLGQGRLQPAVITDEHGNHAIVPRLQMPIVLCFDHRVADGADAIRFLQVIINGLQDPDQLLITMT